MKLYIKLLIAAFCIINGKSVWAFEQEQVAEVAEYMVQLMVLQTKSNQEEMQSEVLRLLGEIQRCAEGLTEQDRAPFMQQVRLEHENYTVTELMEDFDLTKKQAEAVKQSLSFCTYGCDQITEEQEAN